MQRPERTSPSERINVPAWRAYLRDLEELLRPEFTQERWAALFKRTDTPAQAAEKLGEHAPVPDAIRTLNDAPEGRVVYVSSKLRHRDMWLASGIPTLSTWIFGEELPPSECSAMWDRYRAEIARCDGIVLYVEPGDQLKGCMLELGMAFGSGHPIVIVWGGDVVDLAAKIGTIIYHDSVRIVRTLDEARALLS